MAGLPQDRPIPGSPLLDPLGQAAPPILPVAPAPPPVAPIVPQLPPTDPLASLPAAPPPPEPQGYQFDASGQPLPWPPDDWFATPEAPGGFQGHDVPEVDAKVAEPPASAQAGAQGMAALDQARATGAPPPAPMAKPQRPSTGDPYLDRMAEAEDVQAAAAREKAQAEQEKNDYLREQALQIAKDTQDRQDAADAAYAKVSEEADKKRAQLDKEAQDIASQKIDPNRVWHNMSFGSQLFVAIAAGLNGMTTHSVQTGQNPVLATLNQMTERDIAAQQADIDNRWKGVTVRRGLVAEGLAAGHDLLDIRYKANKATSETAANYAQAYAMKWDNPRITADTAVFIAELKKKDAKDTADYLAAKKKALLDREAQKNQQALGWYNAHTSRMGMENEAEARRHANEAKAAGKQYPIRGNDGQVIGYALGEKEQEGARVAVGAHRDLRTLYERGRELFKDGWAPPGSEDRARQEQWNQAWASARFRATGRTDAPTGKELEGWGIDPSSVMGNNLAVLDESYSSARDMAANTLRGSGVDEETLKRQKLIEPPKPPTPGKTDKLLYQDENGIVNNEGRGTPLSPEETAAELKRREKFQRGPDLEEWKYRRSQNNIHVAQGRPGPLPFPEAGTGTID